MKARVPEPGSRPRAERGIRLALSYAAFVAGFLLVAHASGSGWVQGVAALVAGALIVGSVTPLFVARRVRVACLESPSDATAGTTFRILVSCTSAVRVRPLEPPGETQLLTPEGAGPLLVQCAHRGVVTCADLLVSSSFPFGLLWWTKVVRIELPVSIHVSPRVGEPFALAFESLDSTEDPGAANRSSWTGELRSLRPYRPGDARGRVHWPATAHTRGLVVREDEDRDPRPPVIVRADLPADADAAERHAERLLGTVLSLLDADVPCALETNEASQRGLYRLVDGPTDARRRLARAIGPGGSETSAGREGRRRFAWRSRP